MTADCVTSKLTPDLAFISQHLFTAILWVNDALSITWSNAQAEQLLAISRGRLLDQSILVLLTAETLSSKNSTQISNDGYDSDSDSKNSSSAHGSVSDPLREQTCSLMERFDQARNYQQPFIDHDHLINTPLNGNVSLLVDYSVTPVVYEQQTYFIIEMWGKDRQSRISEEQRQQQQYDVARHMLRSVAHEIKNPLAGIRGAAQLLQRQFIKFSDTSSHQAAITQTRLSSETSNTLQKTTQKLRSYTDIIISETDRLTQLIGQFLGSNRLPNWQMLNIHEPLEHVLTLVLSQYPQVRLQRDYDLSLPELCADKDQLIQVFLNLINNACESMTEFEQTLQQKGLSESKESQSINAPCRSDRYSSPNNKKDDDRYCDDDSNTNHRADSSHHLDYQPTLHIQTRVAFQHTIGGQPHKQVLKVTITDNGSGIDPALIGQIFFPMVTSRAAGTGLGLSIVQDIISRHHGMIDVSSTQRPRQEQTRFTLYLPFYQPKIDQ